MARLLTEAGLALGAHLGASLGSCAALRQPGAHAWAMAMGSWLIHIATCASHNETQFVHLRVAGAVVHDLSNS